MNLVEQLKRDEGCKPVPGGLQDYKDSKGLWTRGYGHLITPQPGPGYVPKVITQSEADILLAVDIAKHQGELDRALPWARQHTDARYGVLLNMAFNLGITRLLGFKNFIELMRTNQFPLAAIEALDSKWYREDVGPRAIRLAKQLVLDKFQ